MTLNDAAIAALALLIGAFGTKVLIPAIREWYRGKLALRKQHDTAKDEEREDTARHFTLALNTSEDARKQIAEWMREERRRYDECRQECARLGALVVELQGDMRALRRDLRDAGLEIERLQRVVASQRETMLRDYVRRPESIVPAGPPEEPVMVALRGGKKET